MKVTHNRNIFHETCSLLVFPYFLLIAFDKLYLFSPQLSLYLLFFPSFSLASAKINFIPLLLSPAFAIRRSFPYFTNFFVIFFKFFLIFVVSIQFSSSLAWLHLRVRTVAKRHMRSSMFTASFILVSCVKLP